MSERSRRRIRACVGNGFDVMLGQGLSISDRIVLRESLPPKLKD
jgi:hypothetical protein